MTQNDIYEMFRAARREHKHLVDVTGVDNWLCPQYPEIENFKCIPVSEGIINEFQYCPFCGKMIENNKEVEEEGAHRYVVGHDFCYFVDETIPGLIYRNGYDSYDRAMEMYRLLDSIKDTDCNVWLEDTEYGVTLANGEWN